MPINPDPPFLSDDDRQRAYSACGKIALRWGPIELLIEHLIVTLRNRQRDTNGPFPVSFSRKVEDLKKRLKSDGLTDVADVLRPLISRAKALHTIRGHIVHSYFQGQRLDGTLMFGRSDQKRGVSYTERDSAYSIAEVEHAANEMTQLHDEMEPTVLSVRVSR